MLFHVTLIGPNQTSFSGYRGERMLGTAANRRGVTWNSRPHLLPLMNEGWESAAA